MPLAMVVLPEPLVGAAMRKLGFMGTKIHTFCFFLYVGSIFFTFYSSLFTLFCILAHEKGNLVAEIFGVLQKTSYLCGQYGKNHRRRHWTWQ